MGVVGGMLATHSRTNLNASVICNAEEARNKKDPAAYPKSQAEHVWRLALVLAPLYGLPEAREMAQVFAIVRRYSEHNPEQWGKLAPQLIELALADSIARQRKRRANRGRPHGRAPGQAQEEQAAQPEGCGESR